MKVFDDAADQFTEATDRAIAANNYLRGQLVLDLISSQSRARGGVLDYGCGPGRLAHVLAKAGFSVHGVDTSRAMIDRALQLDARGLDMKFEVIKGLSQISATKAYDAILCSSVIEYVANPDEMLDVFNGALRRPGVLIISYANKSSLWRRYWERQAEANPMFKPDNHTWDWTEFKSLLAKHGFQPASAPRFFESPCDTYSCGRMFRRVALAGSVGILAARPVAVA